MKRPLWLRAPYAAGLALAPGGGLTALAGLLLRKPAWIEWGMLGFGAGALAVCAAFAAESAAAALRRGEDETS